MNLAQLESTLLDTLRRDSSLSYLRTVETLSDRTFDFARSEFVVLPPAVLSFFLSAQLRARDLGARTYDYNPRFLLFAVARNLRGTATEKLGGPAPEEIGAYDILHGLKTLLAGRRLGVNTAPPVIELVSETLEAATPEFSVYSLELTLRGTFHV